MHYRSTLGSLLKQKPKARSSEAWRKENATRQAAPYLDGLIWLWPQYHDDNAIIWDRLRHFHRNGRPMRKGKRARQMALLSRNPSSGHYRSGGFRTLISSQTLLCPITFFSNFAAQLTSKFDASCCNQPIIPENTTSGSLLSAVDLLCVRGCLQSPLTSHSN